MGEEGRSEDPCTEMEDIEGRGLVPLLLTPHPAGPYIQKDRPEVIAEIGPGKDPPTLDLGPSQSFVLYFLELITPPQVSNFVTCSDVGP